MLHSVGLGVSTFASVGNKYDVSGNDLLLWWRHDDRTKVAIIYLESFGNPRKFARLARQLARRTPLVIVRAGSSKVAQRAARSHTAATATPAVTRDELFRRVGVVATDDLAEAIDAVAFFSSQPLPAGWHHAPATGTVPRTPATRTPASDATTPHAPGATPPPGRVTAGRAVRCHLPFGIAFRSSPAAPGGPGDLCLRHSAQGGGSVTVSTRPQSPATVLTRLLRSSAEPSRLPEGDHSVRRAATYAAAPNVRGAALGSARWPARRRPCWARSRWPACRPPTGTPGGPASSTGTPTSKPAKADRGRRW